MFPVILFLLVSALWVSQATAMHNTMRDVAPPEGTKLAILVNT